ncbi:MAG: 2-succinyl-5-enolpyruvyl-6-hydroxy-3-cyclohexene-1-carboxylic-acid synthase [Kofleriaceae bacterium]
MTMRDRSQGLAQDDRRPPFAPPLPHLTSLDHALATAARADGLVFLAMRAPVITASQLIRAWPDAATVVWSSHELTIVGIGIARELRGRGETRWQEVIAAAGALRPAGAIFVDDTHADGPHPEVESPAPAIRRRVATSPEPGTVQPLEALGIARPRLLGGAAFTPGAADEAPWTGFGDAWFVLPRWTYVHDGAQAWLVLAVNAADADDVARWRDELARHHAAFAGTAPAAAPGAKPELVERGSADEWRTRIEDITQAIARGECSKIVAARTCAVELGAPVPIADVLAALDARHADCVRVIVRPPGAGTLIAASPERLVRRDGDVMQCDALAGTVRLGDTDPAQAAAALLASHKDRREHDLVVTAIRAALEAAGARVSAPSAPEVRALRHVLHLHTPFVATMAEPTHVLELVARLHPTPAVGGTPTVLAVEWIRSHEPVARGWYASPVGWFDLDGNGELAVAIRSGGDRVACPSVGRRWHRGRLGSGSRARRDRAQAASDARCAGGTGVDVTAAVQTIWANLVAATLADAGVTTCVISPGSRSTPLVVALARESRLTLVTIIDERSAAFYALGAARACGEPVALVCTSGSAAAHYLPAIVEASLAGVALIALTADRPTELHACGAAQTIDQHGLYGSYVRASLDLGAPTASELALRAVRRKLVQAITLARGPRPGPVHLDVPLRKPLEPAAPSTDDERALARMDLPPAHIAPPVLAPDLDAVTQLAAAIAAEPAGVIVAGALPVGEHVRAAAFELALRVGYPIIAEAGSQLRFGPRPPGIVFVDHLDVVAAELPAAKLVLQLGAEPVAAAWPAWLARTRLARWNLATSWHDPDSDATVILGAPAATLAAAVSRLEARTDRAWCETWSGLAARAATAIEAALAAHPDTETAAVRAALAALPAGAMLQLGNSLPIRVADHVPALRTMHPVITQRGAAGIDGLVSSAAGATRAGAPVLLVLGDVSFAHDVGGLLAARCATAPLAILVLDNGGGQIFAGLPLAGTDLPRTVFDAHWTTAPGLDPVAVATAFGARAIAALSPEAVGAAVATALASPGVTVIHAPVTASGAHDVRRAAIAAFATRK